MKVGKQRERLEHEMRKTIIDINLSRKQQERVFNILTAKGFLPGDVQKIINGNKPIDFMHEINLGVVAEALYKATDNALVDPENYYDDVELEKIKNFKLELKDDKLKYPITFNGLKRMSDDKWVGLISVQYFVQLHHSDIATYNFDTQRDPIYEKYQDTFIKRPNINPDSVAGITNAMIENNYFYDDITLNILADGREDFEFDETNGILKLYEGDLNLTDGAHREKGAEGALLRNPKLEGEFILILTNYDINKANDYIRQKDKRNAIDPVFLASRDTEDLHNSIVKRLNESSISDLKGKIVTDEFLLNEGFGLTSFNIMTETIKRLWEVKVRKDVNDISNYLIDFFNEIIGIYQDEFVENIKLNKDKNFINHPNMFIYYLTIAKEIQNKENWRDLLLEILSNTDFSKSNQEFSKNISYLTAVNLERRIPKIIKYYTEKIRSEINEY